MARKVKADPSRQPFQYPLKKSFVEPDWTRLPGYKGVSKADWKARFGRGSTRSSASRVQGRLRAAPDRRFIAAEILRTKTCHDVMLSPQMLNTINERNFRGDPVRHYMLPIVSDRNKEWPNHPKASRDSLHESEMWAVEGLTHRYPTKVLAEMISTCPQYCGHCTRMDLVGNSVPQVRKHKFERSPQQRYADILDYLRKTPSVRDVVVSGGDVANVPIAQLEAFVSALMDIPNMHSVSPPRPSRRCHLFQDEVCRPRPQQEAWERGVDLAVHTHVNHANQVTPLVAKAVKKLLEMGFRDVRNQGVLLRGVNATTKDMLELCFSLLDFGKIMPYYFYVCDMIPNSEHWRTSIGEAQQLQHDIMGYLPGFATPRVTCDVPFVGKRWVPNRRYDRVKACYWTKNTARASNR